jgi:signal transduction histidine kinase
MSRALPGRATRAAAGVTAGVARHHPMRGSFDPNRRNDLLAITYGLGAFAVLIAWLVYPHAVGNEAELATVLAVAVALSILLHVLRDRLPVWGGDAAILGSLVLIDLGLFGTKLHVYPMLLGPFYVWVGFVSPLWFSRRRAVLYCLLAVLASSIVVAVSDTAAALAGWVITMATLLVAFLITDFLTAALVRRERLAVVGEMASVVGHDLRNPLGAVSNTLFLLRHGLGDAVNEEQARQFSTAEREIAKATAILEHLGDFVRPAHPDARPVSVRDLVTEVTEVSPARDGVELVTDIEDITVMVDRGHLAQVLTNLVTNAYDSLDGHGRLRVAARMKGEVAILTVQDDGPGMEKSVAERVFEPFFTTKSRGTGLGLAIVRRLVESNGGSVSLETAPGEGATFVIELPIASGPLGGQEVLSEEATRADGQATRHTLLQ